MNILVTGATGTVGGYVTGFLEGQGHNLRVLVRDRGKMAARQGVEVVEGDLTDADDVRRALDGVDRAFLNMADDNGATFASAAGEVGLGHVVLLSSFSVVAPLPGGEANIITVRHRAGEAALAAAGVPSTFLRPAGFDYNILMWAGAVKDGVIRAPYLDVPLPIVHPADIAASAAAVLLSDIPATGAFSITGPETLTVRDQARVLSEVLGHEIRAEHISDDEAKRSAFPAGTPDFVADSVLGTMSPAAALPISGDVLRLTGQAPRTFRQWASDNVQAFQ